MSGNKRKGPLSMGEQIESQMRQAGEDPEARRLQSAAERALRVNGSADKAIPPFVRAVGDDTRLLIALVGWEAIHTMAEQYLRQTASRGARQDTFERQSSSDRPAPLSGAASQVSGDSQRSSDRGTPFSGGASQSQDESHDPVDRSASSQAATGRGQGPVDSQSLDDRPAAAPNKPAGTTMTRAGAAKVAAGIWEIEIGGPQKRLGDLTRKDVINAERRAQITAGACRRLLSEIAWPDNRTPLRAFADTKKVAEIRDSAIAALPELPEGVRHE